MVKYAVTMLFGKQKIPSTQLRHVSRFLESIHYSGEAGVILIRQMQSALQNERCAGFPG